MDLEQIRILELGQGVRDPEGPEDRNQRKTLGFSRPHKTLKVVQVQVNEGSMKGMDCFSAALKPCEEIQ